MLQGEERVSAETTFDGAERYITATMWHRVPGGGTCSVCCSGFFSLSAKKTWRDYLKKETESKFYTFYPERLKIINLRT